LHVLLADREHGLSLLPLSFASVTCWCEAAWRKKRLTATLLNWPLDKPRRDPTGRKQWTCALQISPCCPLSGMLCATALAQTVCSRLPAPCPTACGACSRAQPILCQCVRRPHGLRLAVNGIAGTSTRRTSACSEACWTRSRWPQNPLTALQQPRRRHQRRLRCSRLWASTRWTGLTLML
jgi:hypothetical protein